jgi:amylosucrase
MVSAATTVEAEWAQFVTRRDAELPRLRELFGEVYGTAPAVEEHLRLLLDEATAAWQSRPDALRQLDAERGAAPDWFESNQMLGGVCYVDLYAGDLEGLRTRIPYFRELGLTYLHLMPLFLAPEPNSDGGYAVSSYRELNPANGTMAELAQLAAELRAAGISLVVDFIFNHTSSEHEWARRALARDPEFENFYWIFPDRQMPDAFEATTREIFPADHPGSFVPLPDGRWVWATFHTFQWDLNYSNPAVFRAMAGEMLFLANQGVEVLRMDAVAFIWKQLGTSSENLPQAHLLLQAFNAVCRIAAPALLFKSEAIVHPDDVVRYIHPGECQLSYNPLQMALIWSTLATQDAGLLSLALDERDALPSGTAWVNYVRSHDDIGWTFADEDARRLRIDPGLHRRYLNDFYNNRVPGSFARGVPFQDNPKTGDSRVSGTTASLAGLEAGDPLAVSRILLAHSIILSTGGVPLLYLGDEVGQLNDYRYVDDPGHADDSRWVGRPPAPDVAYAERRDPATVPGALYMRLHAMIEVRKATIAFAGNSLVIFHTHNSHVLGYQRPASDGSLVLVLANVSTTPQLVESARFPAFEAQAHDLISGTDFALIEGVLLEPMGVLWLAVSEHRRVRRSTTG